jgi:predicted MFS family arabinose efflux permease
MLGPLGFGYGRYMLVRLAAGAGQTAAFAAWGRRADRHGPSRALRAAGLLAVAAPAVWAATDRFWALAAVELLDGAAGAGVSLCALNHLYDTVEPEGRLRAIGRYNLAVGAAVFAGAGASALLLRSGAPARALFVTAASLRLGVELLLGPRLREARPETRALDLLGVRRSLGRLLALAAPARQAH